MNDKSKRPSPAGENKRPVWVNTLLVVDLSFAAAAVTYAAKMGG
jgi:hypothetical protein